MWTCGCFLKKEGDAARVRVLHGREGKGGFVVVAPDFGLMDDTIFKAALLTRKGRFEVSLHEGG